MLPILGARWTPSLYRVHGRAHRSDRRRRVARRTQPRRGRTPLASRDARTEPPPTIHSHPTPRARAAFRERREPLHGHPHASCTPPMPYPCPWASHACARDVAASATRSRKRARAAALVTQLHTICGRYAAKRSGTSQLTHALTHEDDAPIMCATRRASVATPAAMEDATRVKVQGMSGLVAGCIAVTACLPHERVVGTGIGVPVLTFFPIRAVLPAAATASSLSTGG